MGNQTTPSEEVKNTEVKAGEEGKNKPEAKESKDESSKDNEQKGDESKEAPKAKTMEEILGGDENNDDKVPLSTFLDIKKEKKALEKEIADLKSKAEDGKPKTEITADLKSIADKYDVDANFLTELSDIIYAKAKGEATQEVEAKLKPLEAKERAERINKAFSEHYDSVMEEMPEYAEVVNKDVIKELSLLPQNAKKTFQQIIEETYGKTVTGKKTFEPNTPRGGKDATLDKSRIHEPEYFKQVMETPELKKEYNKSIQDRINL